MLPVTQILRKGDKKENSGNICVTGNTDIHEKIKNGKKVFFNICVTGNTDIENFALNRDLSLTNR